MAKNKLETEYQPLFQSWQQDPSKVNTGALVRSLDPVLNNAIRSYASDMLGSPTVKSRAKQIAIGALGSYDPAKGSLRSHMLVHLQRLRRVAASSRQIIRMPEQVMRDQMIAGQAQKELAANLDRDPSDQELADHTGLSFKRLAHIRLGLRPMAEGTMTGDDTGADGGYDPASSAITKDYTSDLDFVYDDLDPTNQYIMERAFGMRGHTKIRPTDIAKQLKISPAAISQRMLGIQNKIDQLADAGGL